MEILETVFDYLLEMLGGFDVTEFISSITEAVEYIVSLITG